MEIITSGMLPVCEESVWGSRLSTVSTKCESAAVAKFSDHAGPCLSHHKAATLQAYWLRLALEDAALQICVPAFTQR